MGVVVVDWQSRGCRRMKGVVAWTGCVEKQSDGSDYWKYEHGEMEDDDEVVVKDWRAFRYSS